VPTSTLAVLRFFTSNPPSFVADSPQIAAILCAPEHCAPGAGRWPLTLVDAQAHKIFFFFPCKLRVISWLLAGLISSTAWRLPVSASIPVSAPRACFRYVVTSHIPHPHFNALHVRHPSPSPHSDFPMCKTNAECDRPAAKKPQRYATQATHVRNETESLYRNHHPEPAHRVAQPGLRSRRQQIARDGGTNRRKDFECSCPRRLRAKPRRAIETMRVRA